MVEADFDRFVKALDDFAALRQLQRLNGDAKALFFRAVSRYPLDLVERAIEAHLVDPEEGKYRTMVQPAHIVAQIERAVQRDGRPEADEAWAIALRAQDEAATVVWTDEIAQALTAARPILERRDDVGARVAFRAAYNRLVADARAERRPARWVPSLGTDPARRLQALEQAVQHNLLPAPAVAALLPAPSADEPADGTTAAANIAQLRAMLARAMSGGERRRREAEEAAQAERDRLEHLKAQSNQKVFQATGEQP